MDYAGDDYCDAHQDESLDTSSVEPTSYDQFFIKFEVEFLREQEDEDEDEELNVSRLESIIKIGIFQERCDRLPHNNLSWHNVTRMLHIMEVPVHRQPMILRQICTFADRIANETYNRNKKILPMKVYISLPVDYFIEENENSDEEIRPANELVEENLEKVKIEETELGSDFVCVICMEKMEVGSEATKMPCSHVYHENCLMNWLGVKRVCPTCRFELPS
ncbi:E3 ubiquitin-protein ligase RNF181-like [Solanum tuberosum]|uniref:RING-type E3 ubiquitin transferase n=1 Tax=Solanum tuberosum TaxID=4113 RepID=M1DK31_SOLTU|nr:PREDICTED: E3 ubiquitin-protein ligase RNF181-like [Solanum tuberosum]